MIPPEERRHLTDGPRPNERPGGAGTVLVYVRAGEDIRMILERCRSVMLTILDNSGQRWPSVERWRQILPEWFVAACAPEPSREEAERDLARWRALSPAEQRREAREEQWTLADWLFWLEPSERQWYWWDATAKSHDALLVTVEVPGWPAPLGALEWLLRAAGASEVFRKEDQPI